MAITAEQARARLERMVAHDSVPALGPAEVDDLMLLAARNDSAQVPPGDTEWLPTYALHAAAAEGWRWKAGKVAGAVTVSMDGSLIDRSDMHKACLASAAYYDSVDSVSRGRRGVRREVPGLHGPSGRGQRAGRGLRAGPDSRRERHRGPGHGLRAADAGAGRVAWGRRCYPANWKAPARRGKRPCPTPCSR